MLYYMNFPENLSENEYLEYYNKLAKHLPFFRREKAEHFHASSGRLQSALAYLLLCHALNKEYPDLCPSEYRPSFSFGEHGKPVFDDEQLRSVHFNMSHCRNAIACGISLSPIGIDIQDIRPLNQRLINKYMANNNPSTDEEFSMLWSRIEAIGKLMGCGLASSDISDYLSVKFLNKNNILVISEKKADAFLTSAHFCCSNKSESLFSSDSITADSSAYDSLPYDSSTFDSSASNSLTSNLFSYNLSSDTSTTSVITEVNNQSKCIDIDFNSFVSALL